MKIGRDFTNLLNVNFLSEEKKELLKSGKLKVSDIDAEFQILAKRDVLFQIKTAKEFNLDHVELDASVPNPYLDMDDETLQKVNQLSKELNITLSMHLPYTFVAASIACFQEDDRKLAVSLIKKYILQAKKIGCKKLILHPGTIPYYQTSQSYYKLVFKSVIESFIELLKVGNQNNIEIYFENNTAFENIFFEIEDCLELINNVNNQGYNLKFCFDVAHWATRVDIGKPLDTNLASLYDKIPDKYIGEIHINDYVPGIRKFHPPLHYQEGVMKKHVLEEVIRKLLEKKTELIVLETAVREPMELLNSYQIMRDELNYLNSIIGSVNK